jgi:hypothetical protein
MDSKILMVTLTPEDQKLLQKLMEQNPNELKTQSDALLWALREATKPKISRLKYDLPTEQQILMNVFDTPGIKPGPAPTIKLGTSKKDISGKLKSIDISKSLGPKIKF